MLSGSAAVNADEGPGSGERAPASQWRPLAAVAVLGLAVGGVAAVFAPAAQVQAQLREALGLKTQRDGLAEAIRRAPHVAVPGMTRQ